MGATQVYTPILETAKRTFPDPGDPQRRPDMRTRTPPTYAERNENMCTMD